MLEQLVLQQRTVGDRVMAALLQWWDHTAPVGIARVGGVAGRRGLLLVVAGIGGHTGAAAALLGAAAVRAAEKL